MLTKRCVYCQKLAPVEAEVCSRCGHSFTPTGRMRPLIGLRRSRPSIPPASPHRAGHYSGLHPEDQPFQSAMIAVQHPPELQAKPAAQQEPRIEYLPTTPPPPLDAAPASSWSDAPTEVGTKAYGLPVLPVLAGRKKALRAHPFLRGLPVPTVLTIS